MCCRCSGRKVSRVNARRASLFWREKNPSPALHDNMKYDAIVNSGIEVVNRLSILDHLVPEDAQVEIVAKKAAGYFTEDDLDTEKFTETRVVNCKNNF